MTCDGVPLRVRAMRSRRRRRAAVRGGRRVASVPGPKHWGGDHACDRQVGVRATSVVGRRRA
jgi:hypothetical protein